MGSNKRDLETATGVIETLKILAQFEEIGDPKIVQGIFGRSLKDALVSLSVKDIHNSMRMEKETIDNIKEVLDYANLPKFDNLMQRRQFIKRTPFEVLVSVAKQNKKELEPKKIEQEESAGVAKKSDKSRQEEDKELREWLGKLTKLTRDVIFNGGNPYALLDCAPEFVKMRFNKWNGCEEYLNTNLECVHEWLSSLTQSELHNITGCYKLLLALMTKPLEELLQLMENAKREQNEKLEKEKSDEKKEHAKIKEWVKNLSPLSRHIIYYDTDKDLLLQADPEFLKQMAGKWYTYKGNLNEDMARVFEWLRTMPAYARQADFDSKNVLSIIRGKSLELLVAAMKTRELEAKTSAIFMCKVFLLGGKLLRKENIYFDEEKGYYRQYYEQPARVYYRSIDECICSVVGSLNIPSTACIVKLYKYV